MQSRQTLKEKIYEEIALYENILDLSRKESKFIEDKNIEEVVKLLEEKQVCIQKIGEIEREIQPYIVEYATVQEIKEAGVKLGKLLKEVLQVEKENQLKLLQEFKDLKHKLSHISETKKVIHSYTPEIDIPHFVDKKK